MAMFHEMVKILRSLDSKRSEISIHASNTECRRDFSFVLHGNHIAVTSGTYHGNGKGKALDWYKELTEQEKLAVFNRILAEYRNRSLGNEDFKLAALGITDSGDIYISENTEQLSNDFYRQCAEQNMVTISTQRDVYNQIKRDTEQGGQGTGFMPRNPKYRDVYLMGGRPPEIPIACPCGNCTDLLSKVMLPDSHIWVLPINDGKQELAIRDDVFAAGEMDPGQAWKTTIQHLDRDYYITLPPEVGQLQRDGLEDVIVNAHKWVNETMTPQERHPTGASPEELNRIMHKYVAITMADRMEALAHKFGYKNGVADMDIRARRSLVDQHIQWARCVMAERDDGERFLVSGAKSVADKAMPATEISALAAGEEKLATQGVRRIEVLECSPRGIEANSLRTSSKAAIERAVKKRSKVTDSVTFGYTPFNTGNLSQEQLATAHVERDARQLFPSYYTGKTIEGVVPSKITTLNLEQSAPLYGPFVTEGWTSKVDPYSRTPLDRSSVVVRVGPVRADRDSDRDSDTPGGGRRP